MQFPPSRLLPALMYSDELQWFPPTDRLRFWTGLDRHGVRWLIKFSGGFCAVRERAPGRDSRRAWQLLFHGSQSWTRAQANQFLYDAWNYVENG